MHRSTKRLIPIFLCISGITWLVGFLLPVDVFRYIKSILLYSCIALLLWGDREHLDQYNLDRTSILLIILGGVNRTLLNVPYAIIYRSIIIILAIAILFLSLRSWKYLLRTNWRWAGIGLISSLVVIPISFIESLQPEFYSNLQISPSLSMVLSRRIIFELSFGALVEEMLFRGVLWGYLRGLNWKENKIFWTQGILFWIVHLHQITNPVTFFITVPISTIVFSLLARYSKQVLPSIIAHTVINTVGVILVYYYLNG